MTPLESWAITPTCRFNRGDDGAWDEAVAQLRQVYDAQVQRFGPTGTLRLAIFRERAEGVPQYVYEASAGPSPAVLPETGKCEHGQTEGHWTPLRGAVPVHKTQQECWCPGPAGQAAES